MAKFKIALLCGGPSLERAISLNSARTVLDHLSSDQVEILPVYFDHKKHGFLISHAQLYSNTPADFDFKLKQTAQPVSSRQLIKFLKNTNLVFPVMHGQFGEDGGIQKFLAKNHLPFIGSPAGACALAFDKYRANQFIKQHGFYNWPSLLLLKNQLGRHQWQLTDFFKKHHIKRAVVKPAGGGSSLAVYAVDDVKQALDASRLIFSENIDQRVVVEPFCLGKEFTVIILENKKNQPVAILPTEIQISHQQIFDYRKKYLATRQVFYHCPPRFSDKIIMEIQRQAETLFKLFGLRDFARFDGWLLNNGQICFSDFNPVSGMEQNSFLFLQTSRLGLSHRDLLEYLVKNACRRYELPWPETDRPATRRSRKIINILFGGQTAERQVSVMSGTNTWLKLKNSARYDPRPFLLDLKNQVWRLPYTLTLNHTVEEIMTTCQSAGRLEKRLKKLATMSLRHLKLTKKNSSAAWFLPEKMSLNAFMKISPYIFIDLHGGAGENGQLQKKLELAGIPFNGSNSSASKLGMDKLATGWALAGLERQGIFTAKKKVIELNSLNQFNQTKLEKFWRSCKKELGSNTLIIKPIDDGCSAGIARLYSAHDLRVYLNYALNQASFIPQDQLTEQHGIIEMPARAMKRIMLEKFIATDKAQIINNKLKWHKHTGWIEVTIGLLERQGKIRAFNPSLTVASGNVLTLEEKFQGGTGINITPPPAPFVRPAAVKAARDKAEIVAQVLSLNGYARLDAFMNIKSGELIIIEVNTLPGLTPATVIFHQAMAENPPLYPKEFLEKIVEHNY